MKEFALITCALVVSLLLIAASIFRVGDRHVMTPPPEATVESFLREISRERFDRAMHYVSTKNSTSEASIQQWASQLTALSGEIKDVKAKPRTHTEKMASAVAEIKGEGLTRQVPFALTFEKGLWAVSKLPVLENP